MNTPQPSVVSSNVLPDLGEVIEHCRERIDAIDPSREVIISSENAERFMATYREQNPRTKIFMAGEGTFVIQTGEQTRYVSVQELPALAILAENLSALEIYRQILDRISAAMGFKSRTRDGSSFWEFLPSHDWRAQTAASDLAKFQAAVDDVLPEGDDRARIQRFISEPSWGGMANERGEVGKKLNRSTDWQESAVLKTGGMVAAASAGRVNIIRAISGTGLGADLISFRSHNLSSGNSIGGVNKIYYGAPGTGKSHAVNGFVGQVSVVRTVFHPDTQNSDFFGCLKPRMRGDKVAYEFAPGPFCNALKAAFLDPAHHHCLVIEELNRAPAAAVFGELFQLLDRNQNGDGEYKVDFPNPESHSWFKEQGVQEAKLRMPSNLSIIATMNSADQGVYPLDTAFRRRWEQEYLPLYDGLGPQGVVNCFSKAGTMLRVSWRDFAMALNNCLLRFDIPEDRLLGLWFVKEHELNAQVPAKILLYLWDDLLRHGGRGHVFASGIKTFGQLDAAAKAEKAIFADAFLADLEALPQVRQHTDAQVAEAQIDAGVEEDEPDAKAQ